MKLKLNNDIDLQGGIKSLEILKQNTNIFQNWNKKEIAKLSDYMRFFTYSKSTQLAIKGEQVDYFGLLINGRALIQVDNKVYGYLGMGDMIGYMGMIKMPGASEHHFDIVGEKDGIMAAIRVEDLKILNKKEPIIGFKLIELMNRKAYDIVLYQFEKQHLQKEIKMEAISIPQKRLQEYFEAIPSFSYFNAVMEKRDMRYLLTGGQIIEFDQQGGNNIIYEPGAILGRQEFLQQSVWPGNIFGRFSGIFIKLTIENLQDIAVQNAQSAGNLLSQIMNCGMLEIKRKYEEKQNEFNEFKKKYRSQDEEKQEMDIIMQRLKKEAEKKLITDEEYQMKLKNRNQNSQEEPADDYEELKNDYTIIQSQKNELQQLLEELKKENLDLRHQLKEKDSQNKFLNAKVNKQLFQKELLSKGLQQAVESDGKQTSFLTENKRALAQKDKFNDILDQQLSHNRKLQLVTKCGKKWLRITKQNILKKKLTQSSFFPNSTNRSTIYNKSNLY
ncbi:Cyclic nucleotide-binding protein [Pseudocohnilembus persalinus]|uniref:Cyclic nucleotide-binding protein n=1 Tax=Pseudocohnilembus persalinus TaxID=266149 RepID=A0A0V0QYJ8_PSEPJ|nr:Cyclic nucleotide-binding protein [Pseudocohnilembus persalinus]|eukprot:KRX06965.1 Cyclic nucleotide-binding protein [Pseudocohnilembus persalinus]